MFLTTSITKPVSRLLHWLQQRWHAEQWLVDKDNITPSTAVGWRKRVLLSRCLCLFYNQDLSHVPATRRQAALAQQIKLLSPFTDPGFYAQWQGAHVRLWLWDQAALAARLPQAAHYLVLPDSALSPLTQAATPHGDYTLLGISGQELQTWQEGVLQESRWLKGSAERQAPSAKLNQEQGRAEPSLITLALDAPAPLQATDKRLFGHLALACVAALMLMVLLLQAGGAVSLWQQHRNLEQTVRVQNEQNKEQQQAMRRALAVRDTWLARQGILQQPGQLGYIQQLAKILPRDATFWQRYSYEPGRLQFLLIDPKPDPRDYVRIIGSLPNTQNVQVQLDAANQRVTVQADIVAANLVLAAGDKS